MRIKIDSIKIADVRPIYMSRVAAIVMRVQRGEKLASIVLTPERVLVAGEHEVYAARRLGFIEVDAVLKGDTLSRSAAHREGDPT